MTSKVDPTLVDQGLYDNVQHEEKVTVQSVWSIPTL